MQNNEIEEPKEIANEAAGPNRRQQYIVDKKFQYRFAVIAVSATIVLVNAAVISMLVFFQPYLVDGVPWSLIFTLAIVEAAVLVGVLQFSIRGSHSIAGPMHVLKRNFKILGQGDFTQEAQLRKTDHFQDVGAALNDACANLRQRLNDIKTTAKAIHADIPDDHPAKTKTLELLKKLDKLKTGD